MNLLDKAYCGDGLLQCIIGELYLKIGFKRGQLGAINSNLLLSSVWGSVKNIKVNPNLKKYADLYEAEVYKIFINDGYNAAKEYVKETLGRYYAKLSIKAGKLFE